MTERSIFLEAADFTDPSERGAFLDRACADNADLRRGVEALLAAHAQSGSFMRRPAAVDATGAYEPLTERPGMRVGPYKLLQEIGEGGMGIVFMAEQEEPVRRKVALKIIKPGMDSKQVVARFEAERQALSMMDHPNIARVLDAGTTPSGRPYFVMELVHGVPITEFCDANKLSPRERLNLFIPVCQAIQHAHMKGVIHRDIKPSNVLVTMYDDKPVPKVIDFGVAKAVEQRLTERTLFTQYGALVGTFEYMSPEQAEMNAFGVDTRSDVYSLGVLLYELLTGTTPVESGRLRTAALGEVVRIIKEEEPPRPSQRLSTSGTLAKVAAARKTDPGKLAGLIRGELDWIVMRCLEKDRTRRYESATGLAKDVERFLRGDTVEACPPSLGYRLRKLYRRNRAAVWVASSFALLLTGAAALASVLAVQATRAERAASDHAESARHAQAEAVEQRDAAVRLGDELRQTNYATSIGLASAALDSGQVAIARDLLERTRPAPGAADHRGFEWFYLHRALRNERETLPENGKEGWECEFSPDGRFLAVTSHTKPDGSGRTQGFLRVCDLKEGRDRWFIPLDSALEVGLAFSPEGALIAGVIRTNIQPGWAFDSEVRFWDAVTGTPKGSIRLPAEAVDAIAFSPNGQQLVVTRRSNRLNRVCGVTTYDVATGKEVRSVPGMDGASSARIAFDRAGHLIVADTRPGVVRLQNIDTGAVRVISDLGSPQAEVMRLQLNPTATRLALGTSDGQVRVWDVSGEVPVAMCMFRAEQMNVGTYLHLSADGRYCAASYRWATPIAPVWDLRTGNQVFVARGHTQGVTCVAFHPDGRSIATTSWDKSTKLWSLPDSAATEVRANTNFSYTGVAERADGGFSALTYFVDRDAGTRQVVVLDIGTGAEKFRSPPVPHEDAKTWRAAQLAPDGSRVLVSAWTAPDRVQVWDVATKRPLATIPAEGLVGKKANFLTTDRILLEQVDGTFAVWDLATGKHVRAVDGKPKIDRMAVSRDGQRLATTEADGAIRVSDFATGAEVRTFRDPRGKDLWNPALNADGTLLAVTGSQRGDAFLCDVRTGTVRELRGHGDWVRASAFSPDGRRLFSGSTDMSVKVWDTASGLELLTIRQDGELLGLAVSKDGHRLAVQYRLDARGRIIDATPRPEERK